MNPFTGHLDFQHRILTRSRYYREYTLPPRTTQHDDLNSVEVGQTPNKILYSEKKLNILHYEPLTDDPHDMPLLVVYALINCPYIPDKSVVRRFLDDGFNVYPIDWRSLIDALLTLGDYVNQYIDSCDDIVRERTGTDAINVLGYCMGSAISTIYAALHPERLRLRLRAQSRISDTVPL
ncbi:alpha/beta fold hydrolase [Natrinema sp. 1APR25-10V2]|uniref:alpha/beta fold hydrolase n=1 Tax=Natrinema sp. 1APR25-10V2 TaxID=2951081 RepID=UPI00287619A0|nr:alpha/beta fold hydrolase [Natrinema sp. 1APR25-10V2]MDS0474627.1 alpha/beta fold hydrolase [Natrinema sp. 1APR25-10V2]